MTDCLSQFNPKVRKHFDKLTAWLDFNGIDYHTAFAAGLHGIRFEVVIGDRILCLDNHDLERGFRSDPWDYSIARSFRLEDVARVLRKHGYECANRTTKKRTDANQGILFA